MRIHPLAGIQSPDNEGYWRESAVFENSRGLRNTIWIDIPLSAKAQVSPLGNHWLVCGFMLALASGEDVDIDADIDEHLTKNLRGINAIFNQWFHTRHWVAISAGKLCREAHSEGRNGLFFSGGVDSMFSLINAERDVPERRADDLIAVWGFDINLTEREEFLLLQQNLEHVASSFGKRLIPVITNLRSAGEPYHHEWGLKGHGAALATIAHLLSPGYSEVRIASSFDYRTIFPWGSHPFTDPIFSSSGLTIVHDGAAYSRVEKTALIARFPQALAVLHVCNKRDSADNCSHCGKCIRTMITLDIVGARNRSPAFDWSGFDTDTLAPVWLSDWVSRAFFEEIRVAAGKAERQDIVNFCNRSFAFSRWMRPIPQGLLNWPPVKLYERAVKAWLARRTP